MDEGGKCDIGHHQPLHHTIAYVLIGLTVLARAFGRQQDLLHDALARQRAVGVGPTSPRLE